MFTPETTRQHVFVALKSDEVLPLQQNTLFNEISVSLSKTYWFYSSVCGAALEMELDQMISMDPSPDKLFY